MSETKYTDRISNYEIYSHQWYLETLKYLRYTCIDDIPEALVEQNDSLHLFKCRTSWWSHLRSTLQLIKKREIVETDSDSAQAIDAFLTWTSTEIDPRTLRTIEQINKANLFIEELILDLENMLE